MPTMGIKWLQLVAAAIAVLSYYFATRWTVMDFIAVNLRFNLPPYWVGPTVCPNFEDVVDARSMENFSYETYQGRWYAFAHDEPTQPTACQCDTFDWKLLPNGSGYESYLQLDCQTPSFLPQEIGNLRIQGRISRDRDPPGVHLEGAPDVGADFIPQFILWVQKETHAGQEVYTRSIVYSCKANYLGMKVFHSTQFFSRDPYLSHEEKVAIINRGRAQGLVFNRLENIKFTQFDGCDLS